MSDIGIIYDEPMASYHGCDAIGCHDLTDLTPHPLLFFKRHVEKSLAPDPSTAAQRFGAYFHCLALEGEEAAARDYIEAPEGIDRRTNVGKAAYAKFEAEAANRTIISSDDNKLAWRMLKSIREKPSLCALLDSAIGKPEVTFRCQMQFFRLQCRSDWFIAKPANGAGPMDVNVKTVDRLADFDFHYQKFGYYRNSAFYRAVIAKTLGIEAMEPQMAFLVVEKNEPFQSVLRIPDAQSLDTGWGEVQKDLVTLRGCFESGKWPGETDAPKPVSLPEWKTRQ
jgi:hypothetical protein